MGLNFYHTKGYKEDNQFIIGITGNKENVVFKDSSNKDEFIIKKKYELNLWLGYHGFHI